MAFHEKMIYNRIDMYNTEGETFGHERSYQD